jgi:hypothetical protein
MKFHNPFRKRLPVFTGSLQVHVIDDKSKDLRDLLGISRERGSELLQAVSTTWDKNVKEDGILGSSMIEELSSIAIHPNELWFLAHVLSALINKPKYSFFPYQ